MKIDLQPHQTLFMHLTLLPFLKSAGETKNKTYPEICKRNAVPWSSARSINLSIRRTNGIRGEKENSFFTNVQENSVISMPDVDSIYKIPIELNHQNVDEIVLEKLKLNSKRKPNLSDWKKVIKEDLEPKESVKVSMVGKYTELADAYKSLNEALKHGGFKNNLKVDIDYVDSRD